MENCVRLGDWLAFIFARQGIRIEIIVLIYFIYTPNDRLRGII